MKYSLFIGASARGSALFITEDPTLKQDVADGSAIDRNESFLRSGTIPVNRVCDQLFARAAGAEDQNGPLAGSNPVDEAVDFLHPFTVADHAVLGVKEFVEAPVLTFKPGDVAYVFERYGRRAGNGFEQFDVFSRKPFETGLRHLGIDHADLRTECRHGAADHLLLIIRHASTKNL